MNPKGARFDKMDKTVEKYSDLSAKLLTWGVLIQKVRRKYWGGGGVLRADGFASASSD